MCALVARRTARGEGPTRSTVTPLRMGDVSVCVTSALGVGWLSWILLWFAPCVFLEVCGGSR